MFENQQAIMIFFSIFVSFSYPHSLTRQLMSLYWIILKVVQY